MLSNVISRVIVCQRVESMEGLFLLSTRCYNQISTCQSFSIPLSRTLSRHLTHNSLLQSEAKCINISSKNIHSTASTNGRYGHRLVKLWEQKKYTTEPLKVYRTGGRLPVENWKGA